MSKNKKKDKVISFSLILCLILSILAVGYAMFVMNSTGKDYNYENDEIHYISSYSQLKELNAGSYNDHIILTNDIIIDDNDFRLGGGENPFEGIFDGAGYSIIFDFASINENSSLFYYIAEEGLVQNLELVINDINVNSDSCGLFANINDGTIKTCKVTFNNIQITQTGMYSPLVTINRGVISEVYIQGLFTKDEALLSTDENLVSIGYVCVYNYGIIEIALVEVDYFNFMSTDNESALKGEIRNFTIGGVLLANAGDGKVESSTLICLDDCYLVDTTKQVTTVQNRSNVFIDSYIFSTLGFNNNYWKLESEHLYLI